MFHQGKNDLELVNSNTFSYTANYKKYSWSFDLTYIHKHVHICILVIEPPVVAETVKRLPAMQETWVRSLGQKNTLEKEMATHSSTLAWKIPWTEEPGGLQSMGLQRVRHDWATSLSHTQTCSRLYVGYRTFRRM